MSKRRRWLWAVVLLCGITLAVLMWRFQSLSSTRQIVFSDRCQVKLRALTFGTNHVYATGNLFQRTVGRRLPGKWKARFRVREMQVRLDPDLRGMDVLAAWVEVQPATNNIVVRVADSAGREQVAAQPQAAGATLVSGEWVTAHVFSSFPRREPFVTLRVYVQGRGVMEPVTEFRVSNPAYRRYPVWKAEALPIARETNGHRFTLTGFSTGLFATGGVAHAFGSNWTLIEYEADAGPWHSVLVTLTDASGNRFQKRDPMQRLQASDIPPSLTHAIDTTRHGVVSAPAMLWLDEPAWKLHLELERRGRSGFRTNEFWDVPDIAVPAAGQTNFVNLSPDGYGTNLTFESISTQEAARKIVRIEVSRPSLSDLRLSLLNATDARGTNILFVAESPRGSRTVFRLAIVSPDADRLNLRFAVHKVIALDFLARPQLLHTNIARDEW